MNFSKALRKAIIISSALITLGGCAGSSAPYTVSPSVLTFVGVVSPESTPAPQIINVKVNELTYLAVFCTAASYIVSCNWSITGPDTAEITVVVTAAATQGAGNWTGAQVMVVGCQDNLCNTQHSNSPQYVDVNYDISPTFGFKDVESLTDLKVYPESNGFVSGTFAPSTGSDTGSQIQPVADPEALAQRLGISQ